MNTRARSDMLTSPRPYVLLNAVGGIESLTIVRDSLDLDLVTHPEEPHVSAAGAGMCDDVPQGFLLDRGDAQRSVRGDGAEPSPGCARHRHAVCTPELATVGSQALHQPQMLQHGRVEILRESWRTLRAKSESVRRCGFSPRAPVLTQLLTDLILALLLVETTEGD